MAKRQYKSEFLELGFTGILELGVVKPQCVICGQILSNESLKPNKLKRHLEGKHPTLVNEHRGFFERKERQMKDHLMYGFQSGPETSNSSSYLVDFASPSGLCEPELMTVPQQVQQQSQQGGGQQGGGGGGGQGQQQGNPSSPSPVVPIAPKKVSGGGVAQQQTPVAAQPPPEVCLRWNSYYSNMQATFPSLLNNEQFVDVTLACEGRSIKCHKVMLSACSSYFEELLSQNPCQHPIVFMRDLKFWEVQALVEFMYSGEVNVAQDRLPSLLAAAEALQIKGLTGPSNSSSSHDEDSLPVPEIEDSPSHYHSQKRPRKRKIPSTPSYHQPSKAQLIGQMNQSVKQQPVKVPMNVGSHSQVVGAGGYPSSAVSAAIAAATQAAPVAHSQSRVPSPREHHPLLPIQLSKIKRETSSPVAVVKQEPIDMSTDYSQGDSDTGQSTEHEMSAVDCTTTITIEPGPIGLTMKGHHQQHHQQQQPQQQPQQAQQQQQNDNGLSEDDDQTESSNCSEDQQRFTSQQQADPGESGGGGGSSSV